MADQREQIIKAKAVHTNLLLKVSELETRFRTLGCRYRNDATAGCEHARNMVAKWPGQVVGKTLCKVENCPRN